MLMFNPCEEIYGPWKRNEVQNHHACIYHANFPACRGPWNWIWNLQDPTGIEFTDRKQIKEPYLQLYCQSSRAKHGTLNGLEIYHCQKLMPQINVQRNREFGVATIEWDWNSLQRCDISQTDPNLGLTNWKSFTTMWYTTNRKLEGGTLALRFNGNGM